MDKIWSNLYKKYKKETGHEPWQLSEDHLLINSKPENKVSYLSSSEPITFEVRPDPELIIKSILEHFPYLKFGNSFRGIDNYDFTSPLPWNSPCPICDGKHGNYGLHDERYHKNGNQFPYDPELAKLYSQGIVPQYEKSVSEKKIRTKHCAFKVGVVVTMHFNKATQDYKLMVFFVPGFFEDHKGTNETDYGINDRILY
ncbi:hypothetical protein RhiirA5_395365 [Rhizophagus irregularis]|uniref:Uncharacterized protein n=1 Tax=Rhizophagus irregularis TaxID=588596 RepID=A0A2N0S619_9GLOM|nr:hypothetical protein RhiirA5_395365 [Rhizophagus irregularis]PKC70957.1 hypothetical protein RhiirA1_439140 [Rhizophagus irregularis]GBC43374.2 hypothetical protein GLOIN_2v1471056 [Rhizophagus irregularis DAOM 181602=DAOM 197198]